MISSHDSGCSFEKNNPDEVLVMSLRSKKSQFSLRLVFAESLHHKQGPEEAGI